uniref:Uncharacterized protein n=1 Tax=Rhizophora mucronata TaxID=61149 RepID=A0A2P2NAZ3_RHIMU
MVGEFLLSCAYTIFTNLRQNKII